jgi:hypothetical protein
MHRTDARLPKRACALAVLALLLSACRAAPDGTGSAPPQPDTPAVSQPARTPRPPHVFNPDSVQVGDSVVGLRIDAMEVQRPYDGKPVGNVRFAGEARVSGRYQRHPDTEVDLLCFFADTETGMQLPRFPHDERRPWFCFTNQEDARRMLRTPPDTGQTAIVVDGFAYHFGYSDGFNQARLVRVEGDGGR